MNSSDKRSSETLASANQGPGLSSKHVGKTRIDEPSVRYGDKVWWNGELYVAESVEMHGEKWKITVVKPRDFGSPKATAYFAPWNEIEIQ